MQYYLNKNLLRSTALRPVLKALIEGTITSSFDRKFHAGSTRIEKKFFLIPFMHFGIRNACIYLTSGMIFTIFRSSKKSSKFRLTNLLSFVLDT